MSTPAAPTIPPRPMRNQNAATMKIPEIPPRPLPKHLESNSRDHFPASPLNEPFGGGSLSRTVSREPAANEPPARPPSVSLPSIGQEGNEYADIHYGETVPLDKVPSASSTQTRRIDGDLPMHAPKPSLPTSSAKAQVQAVTRTDSSQAAAHGIGKSTTPVQDEVEPEPLSRLRSQQSFSRPGSSSSYERRQSVTDERGPAELGIRVPINPYLGDVQAPSPAPMAPAPTNHSTHSLVPKRHHHRTRSGREVFLPPGSYGLHGHGVVSTDKFEKDWYAKHPDLLQHEESHGHYAGVGSGRGESALSSEDLNKIVRDSAHRGAGFGTSPDIPTYPNEQVGYLASEQYSSRKGSPQPAGLYKLHSNPSQPIIESPLRKTSFPADIMGQSEFRRSKRSISGVSDKVLDSETETEDESFQIKDPAKRYSKITGGQATAYETEDFGPNGDENGGWVDEHGYGVPILASDEVAKEVGGEHMHPAISPRVERRGSAYDEFGSGNQTPHSQPQSRAGSRPGSVHGGFSGLARFVSRHEEREDVHTPLEDVEEYEPLFPDDDGKRKPINAADRFKMRPESLKHRFPSQDIWEDAPKSQLHIATVSTPDLIQTNQPSQRPASTFETPEQEASRKGEVSEAEKAKLIPREERLAKSHFAPHLRDDMAARPGMQNRFPSQDIWEDSPDSMHLVTTVGTSPPTDMKSIPDVATKPTIPARPANRSKLGEGATEPSITPSQPMVPARPPRKLHQVPPEDAELTDPAAKQVSPIETKKAPVLPDRPKPQIPARPAKKEPSDGLSKTTSATSTGSTGSQEPEAKSPSTPKAKPAVPARPVGNKIANLKAGFLTDLDKRLQLGPQGPPPKEKEPEPDLETEKAPLSDARKGRAKGPQRRKPAASPSGLAATDGTASTLPTFKIFAPQSIWHISNEDNLLTVHGHKNDQFGDQTRSTEDSKPGAADEPIEKPLEKSKLAESPVENSIDAAPALAPPLAKNMAGESTDPGVLTSVDATPKSEKTNPLDKSPATIAKSSGIGADDVAKASPSDSASLGDPANVPQLNEAESHELDNKADEKVPQLSTSLSDKDLEEMTAVADGKGHAIEEGKRVD